MLLAASTTTNIFTSGTILPFLLPFLSFATSLVINQSHASRSNLIPSVTRTASTTTRKFSQLYTIKSMITSESTKRETTVTASNSVVMSGDHTSRSSPPVTGSLIMKSSTSSVTATLTSTSIMNTSASIKLPDTYRSKLNAFLVASFILIAGDIKGTDATLNFLSNGLSRLLGGGGGSDVSGRLTAGPISPIGAGTGGTGGRFGISAGSFGGGGGGGQSANLIGGLPGLPPGMTMTQDGCLCPVPKAKTKYIAVEVPKIVFVPPKEQSKTKIITIKEVISEPAAEKYSAMSNGYDTDDSSSSWSFDNEGVTESSGSYAMKNKVKESSGKRSRSKSKPDATRHRVKLTRPDDDTTYDEEDEEDSGTEYKGGRGGNKKKNTSGNVANVSVAPVIKASTATTTESNESNVIRDSSSSVSTKEIDSVIKGSSVRQSISGAIGKASSSESGEVGEGDDGESMIISEKEYKTSSSSVRRRRKKKNRDKSKGKKSNVHHRLTKQQLDDINDVIDEQGHQMDDFTESTIDRRQVEEEVTSSITDGPSDSNSNSNNDNDDNNSNSNNVKSRQSSQGKHRRHHHHQVHNKHYNHVSHYTDEERNFDRSAHKEVDLEDEEDEDADDATSRMQVNSGTKGAFTL